MGGERFDTPQPEAYLFGENADLNFLGSRPTVVRMRLCLGATPTADEICSTICTIAQHEHSQLSQLAGIICGIILDIERGLFKSPVVCQFRRF